MTTKAEVVPARLGALQAAATPVPWDLSGTTREEIMAVATQLGMSEYFDVQNEAQAFAIVLAGRELGLPPMQSFRGIQIIKGNVRFSAGLVQYLVERSGRHTYEIVTIDDDECVLEWQSRRPESGEWYKRGQSRFTLAQAKKAGLVKSGGAWETWTEDMLFARALTRGARRFCADALGGAVYTAEDFPGGGADEWEVEPAASVLETGTAQTYGEELAEKRAAEPEATPTSGTEPASPPAAEEPKPPAEESPKKRRRSTKKEPPPEEPVATPPAGAEGQQELGAPDAPDPAEPVPASAGDPFGDLDGQEGVHSSNVEGSDKHKADLRAAQERADEAAALAAEANLGDGIVWNIPADLDDADIPRLASESLSTLNDDDKARLKAAAETLGIAKLTRDGLIDAYGPLAVDIPNLLIHMEALAQDPEL